MRSTPLKEGNSHFRYHAEPRSKILPTMRNITIADSTSNDSQSQIRGLGRYVQALNVIFEEENVGNDFKKKTFINPFFNLIGNPLVHTRLFDRGKKIAVIHDVIPLKHPQFRWIGVKGAIWRIMNVLLLRLYNAIVTDSESSKSDIVQLLHVPSNIISVIYPYSSLQETLAPNPPLMLPYDLKPFEYLIYVGDVNWHKNIVAVAQAAIKAKIRLVCVGGAFVRDTQHHPWLEELRAFMKLANEHPELIMLTGYVDDAILATLFQNALANMLISYDEGFGYSYIEAGHFSTPSILADVAIFHEISEGKGAIFVDPQNVTEVKNKILNLQEDQDWRQVLGIEAKEQSKKYSKDKFRKQWEELLRH